MLILVINIGAISANEITDTNSLESDIEDSLSVTDYIDEETISSDQSLGAGDSSADSYDMASSNLGEADLSSSDSPIGGEEDEEQADVRNSSSISVFSDSVVRGNSYAITLLDSNNAAASGKLVQFTLSGKTYNATTDSNGKASLPVSLAAGTYPLKIYFAGDDALNGSTRTIDLKVTANTPSITVGSTTVIRGKYLYVYLKDGNGKAMANQKVTIKINGKTYEKTTNSNGRAALKIKLTGSKYSTKVYFYKSGIYSAASKSFTLKISDNKPKITVANATVIRGKYLYVFLKDKSGAVMASKKVTIRINGKNYVKTTNSNGRAALKIKLAGSKYATKVYFYKSGVYSYSSKSFTLNIANNKPSFTIANSTVVKGNYLYVYLKDKAGSVMANQKVAVKLNGKTYAMTTNSNGRIALKVTLAAKKYTTNLNFYKTGVYSASSKSFTLNVVNDNSKNSVANIMAAATKVRNYVNSYKRLPETVTVGSYKISIEEFSYLMSESIVGLNKGSISSVSTLEGIQDVESGGDSMNAKIYKEQYVDLANRAMTYIQNNKVPARYAAAYSSSNSKIGNAGFDLYTYCFAKILVFYDANKYLPNYCTFESSVFGSSSDSSESVLSNVTDSSRLRNFTIALTGIDSSILSNMAVNLTLDAPTGSGNKITKKTVILDSDNIYSTSKDLKLLDDIATILKSKGYNVIVNTTIGPNTHNMDIIYRKNVCVFSIYGGIDAGMFVDKSAVWFQNYLNLNNNQIVLGFLAPPITRNLATETWLERAHDDDYSASIFTGLANPGSFINTNVGADYVYGSTASELASNFLNFAVNGFSVGLDGTIPSAQKTYQLTTNANGQVTIPNLVAGVYNISYSYIDNLGNRVVQNKQFTLS